MKDIETQVLPKWPPFWEHESFGGLAIGDKVWTFALPDYSSGWILGPANRYSFGEDGYESALSSLFDTFRLKVTSQGLGNIELENVRVFYWDEGVIDLWDPVLKTRALLNKDGTMIAFNENQMILSFKNKSSIGLNDDGIFLKGDKIKFMAKEIDLGGNNRLAMISSKKPVTINGVVISPSQGVTSG
jgi:hypothetical protein